MEIPKYLTNERTASTRNPTGTTTTTTNTTGSNGQRDRVALASTSRFHPRSRRQFTLDSSPARLSRSFIRVPRGLPRILINVNTRTMTTELSFVRNNIIYGYTLIPGCIYGSLWLAAKTLIKGLRTDVRSRARNSRDTKILFEISLGNPPLCFFTAPVPDSLTERRAFSHTHIHTYTYQPAEAGWCVRDRDFSSAMTLAGFESIVLGEDVQIR